MSAHINTTSNCIVVAPKPEKDSLSETSHLASTATDDDDDEEWASDEEFGSDDDWEDMDVDEESEYEAMKKEFDCKKCLFCVTDYYSQSFEENLQHMSTCHTFFIPYSHLLADAEGLICYLRKWLR